jgi:hypothetical protein
MTTTMSSTDHQPKESSWVQYDVPTAFSTISLQNLTTNVSKRKIRIKKGWSNRFKVCRYKHEDYFKTYSLFRKQNVLKKKWNIT